MGNGMRKECQISVFLSFLLCEVNIHIDYCTLEHTISVK